MKPPKLPDGWIVTGWSGRLYPTAEQADRFNQWAGSLRFLWNRLLDREQAEYAESGKFLWRKELQEIARAMKYDPETIWLADLPAHAVLDVATRMDGALKRMVSERKAGRKCGFPRPKKKYVNEAGVYCVGQNTRFETEERVRGGEPRQEARAVKLPKIGRVRLRGGKVPAKHQVVSARIVREGDRWMFSAQLAVEAPKPKETTGRRIGVDVGATNLAVAFDGTDFDREPPPKPLVKALKRLRRAQRVLSRRKKGSSRRRAQVKRVAALHRKVRLRRHDILHKLSHRLTAKADVIVIETLNVRAMAQDRRVARPLADAAIGSLHRFIAYKAAWRGRELIRAPADFPSTQMCCDCRRMNEMPLGRRKMHCECGNTMDRDDNAAINLYRYPEERGHPPERAGETRVESCAPVGSLALPSSRLGETRMLGFVVRNDHESQ